MFLCELITAIIVGEAMVFQLGRHYHPGIKRYAPGNNSYFVKDIRSPKLFTVQGILLLSFLKLSFPLIIQRSQTHSVTPFITSLLAITAMSPFWTVLDVLYGFATQNLTRKSFIMVGGEITELLWSCCPFLRGIEHIFLRFNATRFCYEIKL